MRSPPGKFDDAKRATDAAINEIVDGTYFTIIAGTGKATPVYPVDGRPTRASDDDAGGGGSAPSTACDPTVAQRWAPGSPTSAGSPRQHRGRADPRDPAHRRQGRARDPRTAPRARSGSARANSPVTAEEWAPTGTSRNCARSRRHCSGTVDIVADPADLAARLRGDDARVDEQVDSRSHPAALDAGRCPRRVRQTGRADGRRPDRAGASRPEARAVEYPLGSWGAEERDYHIQVEVEPAAAGREKLAARVTRRRRRRGPRRGTRQSDVDRRYGAVGTDQSPGRALHRPGRARAGSPGRTDAHARTATIATATAKLQRAMELAVESGNDGTAKLLRRRRRGRRAHRHRPPATRCRRGRRDGPGRAIDPDRPRAEGGLMPTCAEGHTLCRQPTTATCAAPPWTPQPRSSHPRQRPRDLPRMPRTGRRSLL